MNKIIAGMLEILGAGWKKMAAGGNSHLGDRTEYIGLTDVLKDACLFRSLKERQITSEPTPEQAVIFNRGRNLENDAARVFDTIGLPYVREVEYSYAELRLPFRCHVDFQFNTSDFVKVYPHTAEAVEGTDVVFFEIKSSEEIGDHHVEQLEGQCSFASKNGVKAVGFVYSVTPKGKMLLEGPFHASEDNWETLVKRARWLIMGLLGERDPYAIAGLCCGGCAVREECPTFPPAELPAVIGKLVTEHFTLGQEIDKLNGRRDQLKECLIDYLGNDIKFSWEGLNLSLSTTKDGYSYKGADLYECITETRAKIEALVHSLLLWSDGYSPLFEDARGVLASCDTALTDGVSPRSGYRRLDIRGAKAARKEKGTSRSTPIQIKAKKEESVTAAEVVAAANWF